MSISACVDIYSEQGDCKMERQPVVSGSFYPSEKSVLRDMILSFLSQINNVDSFMPKILVVPHAGYYYSGLVAAYAYKQLEDLSIKNVILLGCSHSAEFNGATLWNDGSWKTPLGDVLINTRLTKIFLESSDFIDNNYEPHLYEHSLEVQIPFLQTVISNNFKIIPILLGKVDRKALKVIAETVGKLLDDNTIFIISSDLSHYPSYKVAEEVDKKVIEAVLTNDTNKLDEVIRKQMDKKYSNLATCVCGKQAIEVGMNVATDLNLHGKLLYYANSGDVSKDYDKVVGYASIGWYE